MSLAGNKAVVLRYFLDSHNPPYRLEVIDELCAPEYAEQQQAWHRMEREAFPDKHFEVEDVIAEGDKVVLRWRFRGTHAAPFWTPVGTIPATGRQLTLAATLTYRLEDGKLAEEWACIDWLDVVRQLGAEVTLATDTVGNGGQTPVATGLGADGPQTVFAMDRRSVSSRPSRKNGRFCDAPKRVFRCPGSRRSVCCRSRVRINVSILACRYRFRDGSGRRIGDATGSRGPRLPLAEVNGPGSPGRLTDDSPRRGTQQALPHRIGSQNS